MSLRGGDSETPTVISKNGTETQPMCGEPEHQKLNNDDWLHENSRRTEVRVTLLG